MLLAWRPLAKSKHAEIMLNSSTGVHVGSFQPNDFTNMFFAISSKTSRGTAYYEFFKA